MLPPDLMVFSKHLTGPPLREVGQRLQEIGVQTIDLTVRPGGHVSPERVEDQLPEAAAELGRSGVRIGMISTALTEATPLAGRVLSVAQKLGIQYYKIGYFMYRGPGTLRKDRDEARAKLADMAQLNRQIGIHGGYHNHSDRFIGASLGDVDYLLAGTDPLWLGSYFDGAHATIEGGCNGWEQGLDLIQARVTMLAVKDFCWEPKPPGVFGARRYGLRFYPLHEGNTEWPTIFATLQNGGFSGPVSLHSEYQGRESFADLSVNEVFKQTGKDVALVRQWWDATATLTSHPLP